MAHRLVSSDYKLTLLLEIPMKQTLLFILSVFTISSAFAQANPAVLFSENVETLTLLLNGLQKNEHPTANVQLDNNSKMTHARQIIKNKCMTPQQVKELMELFTYEETKLDFAMFACDQTYDQDNYYIVNDAFDITTEELNQFLQNKLSSQL